MYFSFRIPRHLVQTEPIHVTDINTTTITSLSATFMTSFTVTLTSKQVNEHSVTGNKYELISFKGKAADLLALYYLTMLYSITRVQNCNYYKDTYKL